MLAVCVATVLTTRCGAPCASLLSSPRAFSNACALAAADELTGLVASASGASDDVMISRPLFIAARREPTRAPSPVAVLKWDISHRSRVWKLESAAAFLREINKARTDGALALVKFSQPQCRACHQLGLKLDQLVRRQPHRRIFDVDITSAEGRRIVSMVGGVVGLPTIAVYDGGELIYAKPTPVRLFSDFERKIERFEAAVARDPCNRPRQLEDLQENVFQA